MVSLQQVLDLRGTRGGGRGRADGTQVGPVGGGESGGALEQLPLPLLCDLSREEGRRVALQRAAGRHPLPLPRRTRRGERSPGLLRRQLVGGRLKLGALGRREKAVVGQAAVPRRLIGQALVAGVRGPLGLEGGQRVVGRQRRAQAGRVRAARGQNQGRRVGGVGAPGQGVAGHAPGYHPSSAARASGALASVASPSARPYTSPHHRGPVQAAGLRAVAGLPARLEDGGRWRVQTVPTDHLREGDQTEGGGV